MKKKFSSVFYDYVWLHLDVIAIVILQFFAIRFCKEMESEIAVKVKDDSATEETQVTASVMEPKKEEKNAADSKWPVNVNETSEHVAKAEGLNSSGMAIEATENIAASKLSNPLKVPCTHAIILL